jgi:drug/metabolite transporter (DMT)-like permease
LQQDFFSISFTDPVVQWSVLDAVLLGVVGSAIATVLFYMLVQRAGGLFASLVTYGIPFVAIGWGVIFGESVTIISIISLGIILLGVYLGSRN